MSSSKPSVAQIDPRPDTEDRPDTAPIPGKEGPRTPYDPGIADPTNQPGSAPDYVPGAPKGPMPQM